jgi:hypothetical protein
MLMTMRKRAMMDWMREDSQCPQAVLENRDLREG